MNNTTTRRDFNVWCKRNIPHYQPTDDGTSNRRDFKVWQAATACATPKWQPIATVPKDGSEFIAAYARQGFVKKLVNWDRVHGQWLSKGEWVPGFETNATHWMPIQDDPLEII